MGSETRTGRRTLVHRLAMLLAVGLVAGVGAFVGNAMATHTNPDVGDGNFFHDHIGWLVEQEIANGFGDGTFRQGENVKREQLALWLGNYNDSLELVSSSDVKYQEGDMQRAEHKTTCPEGKRVLAGGGQIGPHQVHMVASVPQDNRTAWLIRWESEDFTFIPVGSEMRVWALCAPPTIG